MPDGWEAATAANGSVYYIDHANQTTAWQLPEMVSQEESRLPADEEMARRLQAQEYGYSEQQQARRPPPLPPGGQQQRQPLDFQTPLN